MTTPPPHTLDAFISHSKPPPTPLATSPEIRDRASIFVGHIYRAASAAEAARCVAHLRYVVHGARPASHEIHAWRCMQTRAGRSGLGGPEDFELVVGSKDDGEQWAGNRILRVMEAHGVLDAVVVVSRWYGGTMLGPARFDHIETCAAEVCQAFKKKVEAEEFLTTLTTLDDLLAELRAELAEKLKKPDYASWIEKDIPRARKLVKARELSIKAVKNALAKLEAEQEANSTANREAKSQGEADVGAQETQAQFKSGHSGATPAK
ncbi:ribosomal protein S5 domain 2-type protein [Schizophyllum fasciatum]